MINNCLAHSAMATRNQSRLLLHKGSLLETKRNSAS
jgi:hypothetical protein